MCYFNCFVTSLLLNIESVSSLNDWKMMAKKERLLLLELLESDLCERARCLGDINLVGCPRQSQSYVVMMDYIAMYINIEYVVHLLYASKKYTFIYNGVYRPIRSTLLLCWRIVWVTFCRGSVHPKKKEEEKPETELQLHATLFYIRHSST